MTDSNAPAKLTKTIAYGAHIGWETLDGTVEVIRLDGGEWVVRRASAQRDFVASCYTLREARVAVALMVSERSPMQLECDLDAVRRMREILASHA